MSAEVVPFDWVLFCIVGSVGLWCYNFEIVLADIFAKCFDPDAGIGGICDERCVG